MHVLEWNASSLQELRIQDSPSSPQFTWAWKLPHNFGICKLLLMSGTFPLWNKTWKVEGKVSLLKFYRITANTRELEWTKVWMYCGTANKRGAVNSFSTGERKKLCNWALQANCCRSVFKYEMEKAKWATKRSSSFEWYYEMLWISLVVQCRNIYFFQFCFQFSNIFLTLQNYTSRRLDDYF